MTISVLAATKSPPNAALHSVDTQKRVVCSNTRLSCPLPLRSVRLPSFQSNHFASLTLRHSPRPLTSAEPCTTRVASMVPDAASVHCHSGILAAKACLTSEAIASFTRALQLEPLLWEAWSGLCALGRSKQPSLTIYLHISSCVFLYIGAKIDIDTHIPIPPHLRDIPSILLEESSASGIYSTGLRANDQTPSSSAPRATGLGFFTPDVGPSTRSRAQQQIGRPMLGSKETLARKAQSVRLLPHKLSLLTPLTTDKRPYNSASNRFQRQEYERVCLTSA